MTVASLEGEFLAVRGSLLKAVDQLDADAIRKPLDPETNSVAVILKHLGGNLRSRFTDFLSTDGEKPDRRRDDEFVDGFPPGEAGRAAAIASFESGWSVLTATLAALSDADLGRTVTIRGEPHTVARALARSLTHLAYHQGQVTLIARTLVGPERWKIITIPRGGSREHDARLGFRPDRP